MGSRSRRTEVKPPQFQPVYMNQQGQFYKTNPEYTKNLQKMSRHPMGAMGMALTGSRGKTASSPQPDPFIPISSPFGGMGGAMHTRQGYGKAKRYNPNLGSNNGMTYQDANNVERNSRRPATRNTNGGLF